MSVRWAKTQISWSIHPVWSESSLCAWWVAKDPLFLHADSRLWSDWADAQAYPSLRLAHTHFVGFVMLQLKCNILKRCLSHLGNQWTYKHTSDTSLIFRELPEMSHKISSKTYHFLPNFWNLPHVNEEFSYIFYTFLINLPEMKGISLMTFWNLLHVCTSESAHNNPYSSVIV